MLKENFVLLYKFIFFTIILLLLSDCNSKINNKNKQNAKSFNDSIKLSKKMKVKKNSFNLQDLTDSLYYFMKQAKENNSKVKQIKFEEMFFEYFPNNFKEMEEWLNKNEANFSIKKYEQKGEILSFFQNLRRIDNKKYYSKFLNICIDGKYEADYIEKGFGFGNKILEDTNKIIPIMNKYSNEQLKSIFKFMVEDAENPDEYLYNKLYKILSKKNKRLAKLLKESYLYENSLEL